MEKIYKAKDVFALPGMTERRIRNYLKEGFVTSLTSGQGRSIELTETDFLKLPMLIALSEAGLKYEQMRKVLNPNSDPDTASETEDILAERIQKLKEEEERARKSIVRLKVLQLANLAARPDNFFETPDNYDLGIYWKAVTDGLDEILVRGILAVLQDERFKKGLAIMVQMMDVGITETDPTAGRMSQIIKEIPNSYFPPRLAWIYNQAVVRMFKNEDMSKHIDESIGVDGASEYISRILEIEEDQ